ncbi:MAG: hypothetical protein AB1801_09290, partial [Chloroflexota bacterium]
MASDNLFDDDGLETDEPESTGRAGVNRRLLLIGVVTLALICLVGILLYRILTGGGGEVAGETPTPTLVEPTEATAAVATVEQPTATPTRVIAEEPGEPTEEPTTGPTAAATRGAG